MICVLLCYDDDCMMIYLCGYDGDVKMMAPSKRS